MDGFLDVNWLAVVVGGVIFMVLGFLWYGPFFGKPWMAMMEKTGWKREQMRGTPVMYLVTLISALISSYVLALIIYKFNVTVWWHGLVYGAVVWVGIGATSMLTNSIFESRPKGLWALFGLYQLVVSMGLGVIFTVWR
jgi:hypothetical protein